ncbi:MAG: hypothetical protein JWN18_116 [Parcubacteria group bacterium]|nr:hypothetical protein [Parcubacteria group bacterium]
MTELVLIVLFIALLISNRSLSGRLAALEGRFKNGIQPQVATQSAPNAVSYSAASAVSVVAPSVVPVTVSSGPDASTRFGEWLKEDWLMKVGALLFIIGCGWFVSYAFANNWIGPVGRITLGVVAGVLVMLFGFWRMLKYASQGAVFLALGAGMTMLSIFAGRTIYGFFTPAAAVGFDFLIASFVSFAAYRFNLKSLAVIGQILAFVAPLLAVGQTNSVFLFSYLLAITLATLIWAGLSGWRDLIVASLVFVTLYSLPYLFAAHGSSGIYSVDAPIVLNFAYIFAMVYLLTGMYAVVKRGVVTAQNELLLAVLNGAFLFLWILMVSPKELHTLLYSAWAIVFAVGSFIAFRASEKPDPFYAYGSVAIAFVAAATAAQLSGATLAIAYTIEALLLVVAILTLTKKVGSAASSLLFFIVPIALSFDSMRVYGYSQAVFSREFFVLFILAGALIIAGRLIGNAERESGATTTGHLWPTAVILGTVYIWYIIWSAVHIVLPHSADMATFVTLTIYTIAGLVAYFNGLFTSDTARRVYGMGLLIFVVARLLFVDVWTMELAGKVITFFAIGILLMSTAFLTKKKAAPAVGV